MWYSSYFNTISLPSSCFSLGLCVFKCEQKEGRRQYWCHSSSSSLYETDYIIIAYSRPVDLCAFRDSLVLLAYISIVNKGLYMFYDIYLTWCIRTRTCYQTSLKSTALVCNFPSPILFLQEFNFIITYKIIIFCSFIEREEKLLLFRQLFPGWVRTLEPSWEHMTAPVCSSHWVWYDY